MSLATGLKNAFDGATDLNDWPSAESNGFDCCCGVNEVAAVANRFVCG